MNHDDRDQAWLSGKYPDDSELYINWDPEFYCKRCHVRFEGAYNPSYCPVCGRGTYTRYKDVFHLRKPGDKEWRTEPLRGVQIKEYFRYNEKAK